MLFCDYFPGYFTAVIQECKHLSKQDKYKDLLY